MRDANTHIFETSEVENREESTEIIYEEMKVENFLIKSSGHRFDLKQVNLKKH